MTDIEDFDLEASTSQAWDDFTARLDEILSVMDASEDLTIAVARSRKRAHEVASITYSVVGPDLLEATLTAPDSPGLAELGWTSVGPGEHRMSVHQEQTRQLAEVTVKTMSTVLEVLHPAFLEPDQLAEILSPGGVGLPVEPPEGSTEAFLPANQGELDELVAGELGQVTGHAPLRNAQGDLAVRVGSTVVFLRSTPDCREVVLFSPLVHDVAGRSRAVEVLNDLNVEARYCRFALHRDRVFVQLSVFARPLVLAHLRQALEHISGVADAIDDELAARLAGRTTYPG